MRPVLQAHSISKSFGTHSLFRNTSFVLHRGEVLAVVGANGSGKSTLMALAGGDDHPDDGILYMEAGIRLAWLHQTPDEALGVTTAERFPSLFPEVIPGRISVLASALANDAGGAGRPGSDGCADEYERLLALLAEPSIERRAREAIAALDLGHVSPSIPLRALSGGEQTKLHLADAVMSGPDLLLLDEPTNHLDLDGIHWLEQQLTTFEGGVLLTSHDRALVDHVATRLLVLPGDGTNTEVFAGTYAEWTTERQRRLEEQRAAYGRQQRADRRLQDHISQLESRSRYIENGTIDFAIRKKAKKIARRSTTLKRRLEREAAAETRVDRPREQAGGIRASFVPTERSASRLVEFRNVTLTAGHRTLVTEVDLTVDRGDRITLVGPNGTGKTTLLSSILGAVRPDSGSIFVASTTQPGELQQDDALDDTVDLTPVGLLRRESTIDVIEARNLLHRILPGHEQTITLISHLSFGERRRLALAMLMLRGCNLLLLDEPTNHMDMDSRETIEDALAEYDGAVIAATHDRAFITAVATRVWSIEDGRVVERTPEEFT